MIHRNCTAWHGASDGTIAPCPFDTVAGHGAADAEHPVVWCPHDDATGPRGRYYPHTWPDGAGAAIRAFFTALP